jgi:hypothetical protein
MASEPRISRLALRAYALIPTINSVVTNECSAHAVPATFASGAMPGWHLLQAATSILDQPVKRPSKVLSHRLVGDAVLSRYATGRWISRPWRFPAAASVSKSGNGAGLGRVRAVAFSPTSLKKPSMPGRS